MSSFADLCFTTYLFLISTCLCFARALIMTHRRRGLLHLINVSMFIFSVPAWEYPNSYLANTLQRILWSEAEACCYNGQCSGGSVASNGVRGNKYLLFHSLQSSCSDQLTLEFLLNSTEKENRNCRYYFLDLSQYGFKNCWKSLVFKSPTYITFGRCPENCLIIVRNPVPLRLFPGQPVCSAARHGVCRILIPCANKSLM